MELKNLYPLWVNNISLDNFVFFNPNFNWSTLKLSLLHQSYLVDLFGVDKLAYGVEVNWVLWSYEFEQTYKIRQLGGLTLPTLSWLWPGANWFEREVWEMLGVLFVGHPDLRRLLTDYGFRSYPLLKSYPLSGYFQVFYSEKNKRITGQPVALAQEFREFDFSSPWLR